MAETGRGRWLPDQHGAWAMLLLPLTVGVVLAGPAPVHVPLTVTWVGGYLVYFAVGRWLRSARRHHLRPALVGLAVVTPAGALTLLLAPYLLRWLPAYLPLLTVSLWLTRRGRERSLANDAVTVIAAALMAPVAFDAGGGQEWRAAWLAAGLLVAYFLGTVLYVKTMIRERGRVGYLLASTGYHLVGLAAATGLALTGRHSPWLVALWAALAGRAVVMPALNRRRARPLRPAVVGAGEIVASLLVTAVVLSWALPG